MPISLDKHTTTYHQVGLCLEGASDPQGWEYLLCDPQVDGGATARRCDVFCPIRTKEEIKKDFEELVASNSGKLALEYPDIMALKWVLDEEGEDLDSDEDPEETPEEPEETPEEPETTSDEQLPEIKKEDLRGDTLVMVPSEPKKGVIATLLLMLQTLWFRLFE